MTELFAFILGSIFLIILLACTIAIVVFLVLMVAQLMSDDQKRHAEKIIDHVRRR